MATRTSSQSGPWSSTSTWGGAAAPGDADDAIISLTHVVEVDTAVTVGNSGATNTVAIDVQGTLAITHPLTLRGDLSQRRSGTVTGSSLSGDTGAVAFDPPVGSTYAWRTPNSGSGTPTISLVGESSSRFLITTSARGGGNWFAAWTAYPPTVALTYVTLRNVGSASQDSLAYTGVSASSLTWSYVRVITAGRLNFNFLGLNNFTCDLDRVDVRDPLHASSIVLIQADTARSSGTRRLSNWTAYHPSALRNITLWARDFTVSPSPFVNVKCSQDIYDQDNTVEQGAMLFDVVVNGMISGRSNNRLTIQHIAFIVDQTGSDNPHYISQSGSAGLGGSTSYRCIFDGLGVEGSDSGDGHLVDGTFLISRPIIINRAGTLVTANEPASRITVVRPTCFNTPGYNCNEGSGGADMLVKSTSGLFVNQVDGIHQESPFLSQSAFDLDYNGFHRQSDATNLNHPVSGQNSYLAAADFNPWWVTGSYGDDNKGQHDLYVDPQFVDETRTAATYYASVLGAGFSFDNLAAELLKTNGTDSNGDDATPTLTPSGYLAHIRAGFTPTNPLCRGAGDPADGSPDLGAEDMTTAVTRPFSMQLDAKWIG